MVAGEGWFADADSEDLDALIDAVNNGSADSPADWPQIAVSEGFTPDETAYYDRLHEVSLAATREAVATAEAAADQQLIHAVRAMDDTARTANELAERLTDWATSLDPDAGRGLELARDLSGRSPSDDSGIRLVALADRVTDLLEERDALEAMIERQAPTIAPNLSALAGPVLAARLIALAGGLEDLAKLPSGTVQVLGAEDALFAHLRGDAPSPKHGVIYTHPFVRDTPEEHRGSAARAVAGKLTIAARIDHYAGDYRPSLERELETRISTIRDRSPEAEP